jgi:hypothetical protein
MVTRRPVPVRAIVTAAEGFLLTWRLAMFPLAELLLLAFFLALAWLWWDSMQAREAAVAAARTACEAEGLQFLDDTVGIAGLRPARNANGRLLLQRAYDFEFSDTGDNRMKGSVVMLGRRVILLNIGQRPPATVTRIH